MRDLIEHLSHGQDLDPDQITQAVAALLDPVADEGLKSGFLRALHSKGETAREIAGFVAAMLPRAVDPAIDPASLPELFNVSTTAMFLLAAGGATVLKHGNRGITSKSGGADVLEALGIKIEYPPAKLRECIAFTGMGFIFAPAYHPSFRVIAPGLTAGRARSTSSAR